MSNASPTRRKRPSGSSLWISAILVLGAILATYCARSGEARQREETAQTAGYLAETLNPQQLRMLSRAPNPDQLPGYHRLEDQLKKVLILDPNLQWISLTQVDPANGSYRHILEVTDDSIADDAVPGDIDSICIEKCAHTGPNISARICAGTPSDAVPVIIGCSSVTLPHDSVPSIIVRTGILSSPIRVQAIKKGAGPAMICLVLAAGLWFATRLRQRLLTGSGQMASQRVIACETITAAFVGICLTALVTLLVVRHTAIQSKKDFVNLARSYESNVLDSFAKIRDVGTQALDGLIVSSDNVTATEFFYFSRHLETFRGATAWAWAVPVSGEELADFENSIQQRENAPNFMVWRRDESGQRVPVEPSEVHFPIMLAAPAGAAQHIRGMDMRSRPFSLQMVESSTAARMPLASPPTHLLHTSEGAMGIIIYHPVFSPDDPDRLLGFALAALPIAELSASLFPRTPALGMDLFVATDDNGWLLIASSDENPPPLDETPPSSRIRPLTVFGNTYAVRSRPAAQEWTSGFDGGTGVAALLGLVSTVGAASIIYMLGRKRDEDIAHQQERRLRAVFENVASVAVQGFQPDGTVIYWNAAAEILYGYRTDEAIGRNLPDLIVPYENRTNFEADVERMTVSKQPVPPALLSLHSRSGSRVEVYTSYAVIEVPEQPLQIYALGVDMTAIAEARKRLELLAQALDSAANGVVIADRDGVIEWVNTAFCDLSGYTKEEAHRKRIADLVKSGRHGQEFYRRMWQVILSGKVWSGEITNRRKDGTVYPEEVTITPVAGADGQINHFIAIKRDLTQEKAHEARILRTQRMESIGTLAGGIAHDINNALTPILMILDSIRAAESTEQREPLLRIIEASVERSASMISQLLTFARGVEGEHIDLDLKAITGEMEVFLKETLPKNIDIVLTVAKDLLPVHGDPTQIHQALLNLCVNARDAMPNGGKLELILENTLTSPIEPSAQTQQMVKITVRDNGCGIPPAIRDRIFDPFFTTKEVGKGSGLGLSTTHSIIKGHGGYIELNSEIGKGTAFELYLPVATGQRESSHESVEHSAPPLHSHQSILIVDDEPYMRQTLELVLTQAGYKVIVAENGAQALDIFKRDPDGVALVITDMAMPVMDGRSAIKAMHAIRPRLPVIGTSGMPSPEDSEAGIRYFISKPFKVEDLIATINKALTHHPSSERT